MKTLNSKNYEYLGINQGWHMFKNRLDSVDPEILMLYRARLIQEDGSSRYFDPVKKFDFEPSVNISLISGITKDGIRYCRPITFDNPCDSAVSVNESSTNSIFLNEEMSRVIS